VNYAELVSLIQQYTENDEATFVANIPTFVQNTERRIFHAAQLPAYRTNKTTTLEADNKYVSMPNDFLYPFSFAVMDSLAASQTLMVQKDVNYIREAYPDPGVSDRPKYYAIFDSDTFILGPTPGAGYTVELHYAAYPTSIVDASTTFIGDNFEHALLYGSLVEAYTYMKGEADLLKNYDTQFKEALLMVKQYGDGKTRHDAYRSGQIRLPNQ
jgi:hypothetical protein